MLLQEPTFKINDPAATIELHMNGNKGYEAVMLQKFDKKNNFHVVYNMSCKMSNVENMLHSYELKF